MLTFLIAYALIFTFIAAFPLDERITNQWAVLVAGSSGFQNYRHQADVAHAYHILVSNGMDPEKIITFSVDDIAENPLNPEKGTVYHDYAHVNYYTRLVIDYLGQDVSAQNFISVLLGDQPLNARNNKTLKSDPNDNVFIYFTGWGGNSFLAFPDDLLFGPELNETLNTLYRKQRYSKLVFYLDSPYSGSVFKDILSSNINVYAMTATNEREVNYADWCKDSVVPVCLGGYFSYSWINDTRRFDVTKRTLKAQYQAVKLETFMTNVQQFGNRNIADLTLSDFQGKENNYNFPNEQMITEDPVPSDQAHIYAMSENLKSAKSDVQYNTAKETLAHAMKLGEQAKKTMQLVVDMVSSKSSKANNLPATFHQKHACFKASLQTFNKRCFNVNNVPEVAEYSEMLMDLCQRGWSSSVIVDAVGKAC